jgi:hypothetical protein
MSGCIHARSQGKQGIQELTKGPRSRQIEEWLTPSIDGGHGHNTTRKQTILMRGTRREMHGGATLGHDLTVGFMDDREEEHERALTHSPKARQRVSDGECTVMRLFRNEF